MLLTSFVACGSKEPKSDDLPDSPSANITTDDGGSETFDETEEITFWIHSATYSDDKEAIFEEINKITESEIGVHVNFNMISFGDYIAQLPLAIANNETIDVCTLTPAPPVSFMTLCATGALYDITDLIDEHGSDIKNLLGEELLNGTTVNGRLYGVSNYRILSSGAYFVFATKALENAGMVDAFYNMQTWADLETVMQGIVDNNAMYAFGAQGDMSMNFVYGTESIFDTYTYDYLGDSLLLVWSDQNGNVDLLYNRPEVVEQYKLIESWTKKGYFYPDSILSSESGDVMISQNVFAGQVTQSEVGIEVAKKQTVGIDVSCLQLADGMISTSSCRAWGMGIPSTAANPAAAMKFLNLMYTNADIMNLLAWGIEGTHYEINENGEAKYLDGKDASLSGYHGTDFGQGNQFLVLPWEGQGGDFRDVAMEDLNNSEKSIYLGLSFDTSDYANMISALSAVKSEYHGQIAYGLYSDSLFEEYMAKLKSVGIDEYIEIYQAAASDFLK